MHPIKTAIVLASSLAFSSVGGDLAPDPVVGLWRLNEAKSQLSSTARSEGVIRSYQPISSGLTRISETRLIPNGQQMLVDYVANCDGKEYPIFVTPIDTGVPLRSDDTVAFRRVDQHTVSGVFRNHGNKISEFTREVSKDGQSLSVRIVGIDSTGSQTQTLLVYDRLIT